MKDLVKSRMNNNLNLMPTLLQSVKDDFDYVVMDCPPELSVYVRSALYYSNLVLVPSTYDKYSFDGVTQVIGAIIEIFDEVGVDFPGEYRVLYTMVNSQATRIKRNLGELEEKMESNRLMLPFKIPVDQSIKTCQSEDGDLMRDKAYKNSHARSRYQDLGNYVLEKFS